nr:MAG TPA: hypothetical protein [Caudoviricetes sp.]
MFDTYLNKELKTPFSFIGEWRILLCLIYFLIKYKEEE